MLKSKFEYLILVIIIGVVIVFTIYFFKLYFFFGIFFLLPVYVALFISVFLRAFKVKRYTILLLSFFIGCISLLIHAYLQAVLIDIADFNIPTPLLTEIISSIAACLIWYAPISAFIYSFLFNVN